MNRVIQIMCLCAALAATQAGRAPVFDGKSYGARGAGKAADTGAINRPSSEPTP